MSSLNTLYIKADVLNTLAETIKKKGEKGVELTLSLNNNANDYGQNVAAWVSQSREERDAGKKRYYVGNGRTIWTSGETPVPDKVNKSATERTTSDELIDDALPF